MNEKIKHLVEQAGTDVSGKWMSTNNAEQFAELIVRECAGKVDNILRERNNGGGTMGDEIREHFGLSNE